MERAAAAIIARPIETKNYDDWIKLFEQPGQRLLPVPAVERAGALNLGARLMWLRARLAKLASDCGQTPDQIWDTDLMEVAPQLKEAI